MVSKFVSSVNLNGDLFCSPKGSLINITQTMPTVLLTIDTMTIITITFVVKLNMSISAPKCDPYYLSLFYSRRLAEI